MSQLIQMRQRIKAIETTKKITHAMRLTAMSSHTRLRAKHDVLVAYKKKVQELFLALGGATYTHPAFAQTPAPYARKELIILVGSQKGLCGNFNSMLFKSMEHSLQKSHTHDITFIAIGSKATTYIHTMHPAKLLTSYDITITELTHLAHRLAKQIMELGAHYSTITIMSNTIKNFFVQIPHTTQLFPVPAEQTSAQPLDQEYEWEQPKEEILLYLFEQYLEAKLQSILFESLLAEQAARFISMDNATRNAKDLLEETQLQYNKIRQTKITRELTELVGSL